MNKNKKHNNDNISNRKKTRTKIRKKEKNEDKNINNSNRNEFVKSKEMRGLKKRKTKQQFIDNINNKRINSKNSPRYNYRWKKYISKKYKRKEKNIDESKYKRNEKNLDKEKDNKKQKKEEQNNNIINVKSLEKIIKNNIILNKESNNPNNIQFNNHINIKEEKEDLKEVKDEYNKYSLSLNEEIEKDKIDNKNEINDLKNNLCNSPLNNDNKMIENKMAIKTFLNHKRKNNIKCFTLERYFKPVNKK